MLSVFVFFFRKIWHFLSDRQNRKKRFPLHFEIEHTCTFDLIPYYQVNPQCIAACRESHLNEPILHKGCFFLLVWFFMSETKWLTGDIPN